MNKKKRPASSSIDADGNGDAKTERFILFSFFFLGSTFEHFHHLFFCTSSFFLFILFILFQHLLICLCVWSFFFFFNNSRSGDTLCEYEHEYYVGSAFQSDGSHNPSPVIHHLALTKDSYLVAAWKNLEPAVRVCFYLFASCLLPLTLTFCPLASSCLLLPPLASSCLLLPPLASSCLFYFFCFFFFT
jgi:hypothetical protein